MKVNVIKLPGVLNARELGGYPAGNRIVRSGVLIRSGVLNKAEPGAIDMPPDKIEALQFASGGVFEHYMTHAMDTLENKYGSVRGYLMEELGLTEPDMERLREKYTV